jgi:ankyrin repeat protein
VWQNLHEWQNLQKQKPREDPLRDDPDPTLRSFIARYKIQSLDSESMDPLEEAARSGHVDVLSLLLDKAASDRILDRVTIAAAKNEENGKEIVELLLDRRGDQITITEEVVMAAAKNGGNGKEVVTLLLDRRGDRIPITEETVTAAEMNQKNREEVIDLLLNHYNRQCGNDITA